VGCGANNPPFGGIAKAGIEQGFPADVRTAENGRSTWCSVPQHNGRAALVLPDRRHAFLARGRRAASVKSSYWAEHLHTITTASNGVFAPYTGIKTKPLLHQRHAATENVWYYEHPPSGREELQQDQPIRIEEFDGKKLQGSEADGRLKCVENEQAR
jgi:type I restriction enzyme M protein